jgi:hypothetical protein
MRRRKARRPSAIAIESLIDGRPGIASTRLTEWAPMIVTSSSLPTTTGRARPRAGAAWRRACKLSRFGYAVPARRTADVSPIGAGVWVAFEDGDPTRPVWIGVSQYSLGVMRE